MDYEVLARFAPLVGVMGARVDEGLLEPLAIDGYGGVVRVLLDDREQVPEQPLLRRRELGVEDRALRHVAVDLIDPGPGGRNQRRRPAPDAVARWAGTAGLLRPRAA
jgi:hypothetical protein